MQADERSLIRRAQRGSPDAVDELFRRHWPGLWRVAYAATTRRELANDVAQEAFVRGVATLERFDPSRPLAPWLTRIAVNLAIDELRRERRLAPPPEESAAVAEREESENDVIAAVARLAPEKRLIVALHYWLDYPTPEIARLLDLPLGTVASRLSRALEELRTDLEAEHV